MSIFSVERDNFRLVDPEHSVIRYDYAVMAVCGGPERRFPENFSVIQVDGLHRGCLVL